MYEEVGSILKYTAIIDIFRNKTISWFTVEFVLSIVRGRVCSSRIIRQCEDAAKFRF